MIREICQVNMCKTILMLVITISKMLTPMLSLRFLSSTLPHPYLTKNKVLLSSDRGIYKYQSLLPFRYSLTERNISINSLNSSITDRSHFVPKYVKILEATKETQERFVSEALQDHSKGVQEDPYGIVLWPAAIGVLQTLLNRNLENETIVELGCGVGLVSLGLAIYSNPLSILATDYNEFSLKAVEAARDIQETKISPTKLSTQFFDLMDEHSALPEASLYVCADILYNPVLGVCIAKRVAEAVRRGSKVILADSPGRTGRKYFSKEIKENYQDIKFNNSEVLVTVDCGYRHNLISEYSDTSRDIPIALYEFN